MLLEKNYPVTLTLTHFFEVNILVVELLTTI